MHVVITGSARASGFGMAREFLPRRVVVSTGARRRWKSRGGIAYRLSGAKGRRQVCDVADYGQVQGLWEAAVAGLGSVRHMGQQRRT
ncbi:MAG: hypothetical protein R3F24_14820 [Gammaproteobacteria bacterium]